MRQTLNSMPLSYDDLHLMSYDDILEIACTVDIDDPAIERNRDVARAFLHNVRGWRSIFDVQRSDLAELAAQDLRKKRITAGWSHRISEQTAKRAQDAAPHRTGETTTTAPLPDPPDGPFRGEYRWLNIQDNESAVRFVPGIDADGILVWVRPAVFQTAPMPDEVPVHQNSTSCMWTGLIGNDPHGCADEFTSPPAEEAPKSKTPEIDAVVERLVGDHRATELDVAAGVLQAARRIEQDRDECLARLQEIAGYQGRFAEATPEESARTFLQVRHMLQFTNDAIKEALK